MAEVGDEARRGANAARREDDEDARDHRLLQLAMEESDGSWVAPEELPD